MNKKSLTSFAFVLIFLVALFFRFYHLADIPSGLNNDAAWEGLAAIDILRGNWTKYLPYAEFGWRGEGGLRLVIAGLTAVMGVNPLTIRLASTIFGIALIPLVYLLIKELFDTHLARVTTFLVAISGWHIIMSRSGWRAIMVPLAGTLMLYALVKTIRTRNFLWYGCLGAALAFSLYTYDAGRILPVLLLGITAYLMATTKNFLRHHRTGLAFTAFIAVIIAIPMILYAVPHWDNFTGRGDYLFVGKHIQKAGNLSPLWDNAKKSVFLFNGRGNGNDFFVNEPLIDIPVSWMVPVGLGISLWMAWDKRRRAYMLMLAWAGASLLPGLLSEPNGNRAISALPVVYFFGAVGVTSVATFISRIARPYQHAVATSLLLCFCGFAAYVTYASYLGPDRREIRGFYPETMRIANHLKSLASPGNIMIFDNYPVETLAYLLYEDGDPFAYGFMWLPFNRPSFTKPLNTLHGTTIVMNDSVQNDKALRRILTNNPDATVQSLPYTINGTAKNAALIVSIPPQQQK